jgi:hypothetical protein
LGEDEPDRGAAAFGLAMNKLDLGGALGLEGGGLEGGGLEGGGLEGGGLVRGNISTWPVISGR